MPVAGNASRSGLLHGGASGVLAESVARSRPPSMPARVASPWASSSAVATTAAPPPVRCTPLPRHSLGRTLATYEIRITDDSARPVCNGSG